MHTYSISLHFSLESFELINSWVLSLAQFTGNDFRVRKQAFPHLTMGMFHAENDDSLVLPFGQYVGMLRGQHGKIVCTHAEVVKKKAVFLMADSQSEGRLRRWNRLLHDCLQPSFSAANNGLYLPVHFVPHIAFATGLSSAQAKKASLFLEEMKMPVPVDIAAQKELEATKKVYFSWSLHDHDVRKHGREEGIRIGEKRGMNEKATESARNMLAMKLGTHEQIAQVVGLPLEKIEELAAEHIPR